LRREPHPLPRWIVVGAGTGGTSATIGRYIRFRREALPVTELCVVDPEGSVFLDAFREQRCDLTSDRRGRVEGIGRPRVEPSFVPTVIDRMLRIGDVTSFAAALELSARLGRRVGPSTGTNFAGVLRLAREMSQRGQCGSIVSLICDAGERYADTLFDPTWQQQLGIADVSLRQQALNPAAIDAIESSASTAMGKSAS
jgi:cysteine synthase